MARLLRVNVKASVVSHVAATLLLSKKARAMELVSLATRTLLPRERPSQLGSTCKWRLLIVSKVGEYELARRSISNDQVGT